MDIQDISCVCRDCGTDFFFTAQEQLSFRKNGFAAPTRCPVCHEKRVGRRKTGRSGKAEVYISSCATCGKDAELPFKPTNDKPVLCKECFRAQIELNAKHVFVLRKPETQVVDIPSETVESSSGSFGVFELDPRLERAIEAAGYVNPTPVQTAAMPICLAGRDIIGTAQTGTGKTAAFILPILQHLLDNPVERPCTRVIILTPTRELAEQINDVIKQLGKFTKIKSATIYGGVGMHHQEHALHTGVDIIVACPGRILDHISRGNARLSRVEKLVLDEADRMLDMGFLPSIKRIISHLPTKRQTMLFSATFDPELIKFTTGALIDPQRVDVDLHRPAKTVDHVLYPCPQHLKTSLVLRLLEETDANSVLIFTRTKHRANKVAQQIEKAGYGTTALHSNKSQNQRQTALDDFKLGRRQIMVATDIAARGLDVETISHVINYDIPDTADTYIHRIGRTGRAEREGDAITLVTNQDNGIIRDIERVLGSPIGRVRLENFDYNAPAPEPAKDDVPKRTTRIASKPRTYQR
ncbi:MAG: DEAD/DEAH box helicase [Armatimonadota bacterium]